MCYEVLRFVPYFVILAVYRVLCNAAGLHGILGTSLDLFTKMKAVPS